MDRMMSLPVQSNGSQVSMNPVLGRIPDSRIIEMSSFFFTVQIISPPSGCLYKANASGLSENYNSLLP